MKDRSSDFACLLAAKRQLTELGGVFYDAKSVLLKSAMRAACERKKSNALCVSYPPYFRITPCRIAHKTAALNLSSGFDVVGPSRGLIALIFTVSVSTLRRAPLSVRRIK